LRSYRESIHRCLRLCDIGLTKLPEEVLELTDLEHINLSDNELQTVPKRLWDLPKLRSVNLIGNPIASLPDRTGLNLIVDGPIYRRCRNQIDPKYINLVIRVDTSQDDADFLAAELRTSRGPQSLTVGKGSITIGEDHAKPSKEIQRILDSLGRFECLESLTLRGLQLGAVPESIRRL
jgi:Leucine-rich repeat (LRR) protein